MTTTIVAIVAILIIIVAYFDRQFEGAETQMLLMNPVIAITAVYLSTTIGYYAIIVAIILFVTNYKVYKWREN